MAVSVNTSNTTATDGTEQTLATISSAGTYQFIIDLGNLANGDAVEVRVKVKSFSGQSSKVLFTATYSQAQGADAALAISPPIPAPIEFVVTLKRVAGTDRSYPWAIYAY